MSDRICVIGGNRYFGRLLVERALAAGHQVTVVNRGSAAPPAGADHVVADRDDEVSLGAALGSRVFDVVVDQVCYTPVQAAVAARVFGGRTRRYVLTSTIEVYHPASARLPVVPVGTPVPEEVVAPTTWPVSADLPWHDAAYWDAHYGEGKRQAEAVLARAGGFGFASVRSAHVLGGGEREWTGRLAHYTERVARGEEIAVHAEPLPSVFVHHEELAAFLLWAAVGSDFTGPVNACSDGFLDVYGLCEEVAARTGRRPAYRVVEPGEAASPFSFDRHYAMSNARAKELGFAFSPLARWLPAAVAEAVDGADATAATAATVATRPAS
ncbi:NAD-dependent epimerase/dehydratase family protein [Streptomyces sp. NPDC056600]|uniref:NAD-dependent epimerase/dehydratase family protein n=1 Tax=Streptomyces sp. NPDC056600 TaxID=3345874 RepID=UPI0036C9DB20